MLSKTALNNLALSATTLQIEPWERNGLIAFVEAVEQYKLSDDKFDMAVCCTVSSDCGTISCIGGYVGLRFGMCPWEAEAYVLTGYSEALEDLYYPDTQSWNAVTAKQAAAVTRHFLTTGVIEW